MNRTEGKVEASASAARWRVGSQVPINVYEGDRPVCQCHNVTDARLIVFGVNYVVDSREEATSLVTLSETDSALIIEGLDESSEECRRVLGVCSAGHYDDETARAYASKLKKLCELRERLAFDVPSAVTASTAPIPKGAAKDK